MQQWQIQDLSGDNGQRVEREPPTAGSRGRTGGGSRGLLKLKAFCQFSYKKWPKFKDLSENLPRV